jgi:hypothetical protein
MRERIVEHARDEAVGVAARDRVQAWRHRPTISE